MKSILSVEDLSVDNISMMVEKGVKLSSHDHQGFRSLAGKFVGLYFSCPSTRTRTSFHVGAANLGATVITYGPNDLQWTTGETAFDTAQVLSSYLDCLVIRNNGSIDELEHMAEQKGMSIVNAMSENEHPTQAISDLITMQEHFGRLSDLHVLYLGGGYNTSASLSLAVALVPGMKLTLLTPEGYGLPADLLGRAQTIAARNGGEIQESHDICDIPTGVDVVYTTRWESMGVGHPEPNWREKFRPFKVTEELMAQVSKHDTVFMHDLPATRGSEVDNAVLDGERSIVLSQARNKLTGAMVALDYCVADGASNK